MGKSNNKENSSGYCKGLQPRFNFESDFNRVYTRLEMKLESYFNFLKRITKEAGINVKLYNDRLILFEEEMYERKSQL